MAVDELCPKCGTPTGRRLADDPRELVECLRRMGPKPCTTGKPRFIARQRRKRLWALGHGHWPDEPDAFTDDAVRKAMDAGWLRRLYPDCSDSFILQSNELRKAAEAY